MIYTCNKCSKNFKSIYGFQRKRTKIFICLCRGCMCKLFIDAYVREKVINQKLLTEFIYS